MQRWMIRWIHGVVVSSLVLVCQQTMAQAAQPPATPQQRVAMLKAWVQASQAQLRHYEWREITIVAKGGEEKDRKENDCYYDVTGALQKVPVSETQAKAGGPPGVLPLGRLAKRAEAHAAEELKTYMENAAALIHQYVPPDANKLQQAVNTGNFSVTPMGQHVRLTFRNYLKEGDAMNVDVEVPTNRLVGISVASHLDSAKDAIQLDVTMGLLPDGTIYTQKSVLNAPAKEVTVTVENSGHRHAAP